MVRDEHEMLVEFSEMTTFDFNSKEYKEIKKDFKECERAITGFEWLIKNFVKCFKQQAVA